MTNADKFKAVFGMYSEEFWAKPEQDMLSWINSEYQEPKSKVTVQSVNWIPVTERLPESVCKSYLCLTDTGYHCEVRWTNNVYGLWKSDNKWGWSIADVPKYCKVTHWMPLPKPPKGDNP